MRPANFQLNQNHPLAQGLVFAGLGAMPGSSLYRDSSLYGRDGTLSGAYAWSANAVTFAGGKVSYAADTISKLLNGASQCSISATITPTAISSNHILSTYIESTNNGIILATVNTDEIGIYARSTYGDSLQSKITTSSPMSLNNTHCITAVIDYANDYMSLYVNGDVAVEGSVTFIETAYTMGAASYADCIGNRYDDARDFIGDIKDVLIHNRALSLPEIQLQASGDPMLSGLILPLGDLGVVPNIYNLEGVR